jgi:hypothetical protein
MKIYIDNDYKCHITNNGDMREFNVSFFDGKCADYIEGHRYVPQDETWIRSDGIEFKGGMIAPFVDAKKLEKAQLTYEKEQAEQALNILIGSEVSE